MSQKVPNMAPKSAQVGAMLGSKAVLDPPKSEEKTTPKTTPKKNNPNINLCEQGTGSALALQLM